MNLKYVLLITLLITLLGCTREVDFLQLRDGLYYAENPGMPFTGLHVDKKKSGYITKTYYKNGKKEGMKKSWYSTGGVAQITNYENGDKEGESTTWFQNGNKSHVITYKRGIYHGPATYWYRDGKKKAEVLYKDGAEVRP